MKLLSWNCKGLTHPSAILNLKVKIRKHSPDIIFLTETKTNPVVACIILNTLGFFLMAHAPPSGSKGGLLLAWHLGDFNKILDQSEKSGGRPFASCSNDPFRHFINSQGNG
ncbi:hypothetical protein SLA2020_268070 [Shorea laevis]